MSANLSAPICSIRDGNSVINFEWRSEFFDSSSAPVNLVATYNGDSFRIGGFTARKGERLSELVNNVVNKLNAYNFGNCLNDPARKALRSSVCENVVNTAKANYNSANRDAWISSAVSLANSALGFANAGGSNSSAELEQLRADLAAARAELAARPAAGVPAPAPAAFDYNLINDMISNAVNAALRPQYNTSTGVITHEKMPRVLDILSKKHAVWLWGPAGTGKSKLAEQVANALDAEYHYTGSILDQFAGLIGFIDANGKRHETEFIRALDAAAAGRDVVMCFDEMDASIPEVTTTLNNFLAGGVIECAGKLYHMTENFHVIACGNTCGRGADDTYTSRQTLDGATLDRFAPIKIDYSPAIEDTIANNNTDLLAFVRGIRGAAERLGLDLLVTYRAIKRLSDFETIMPKPDAIECGVLRELDKSDIKALGDALAYDLAGNPWHAALLELC